MATNPLTLSQPPTYCSASIKGGQINSTAAAEFDLHCEATNDLSFLNGRISLRHLSHTGQCHYIMAGKARMLNSSL